MNPYEAEPGKIPATDLYADLPLYSRYHPSPQDFKPLSRHCNSYTPESLEYWESVLKKCDSRCYVYQNPFGGRDVFALGSIIIKSGHLRTDDNDSGSESARDYSLADANEAAAIQLVPKTIPTPQILFSGKIRDRDVLIQSRIPGVGLNVAWPYLSPDQKASFKIQARNILRELSAVWAPSTVLEPTYLVPDPDPVANRDIEVRERDILSNKSNKQEASTLVTSRLSLMYNDLQTSNIIVKDDQIVGIVDWEHAGWFRWKDVGIVHSQFRTSKREDFARVELSKEKLEDLIYWNDLYTFEP